MTKSEFWDLIATARDAVPATTALPKWLASFLKDQPIDCIVSFEEHFHDLFLQAYDSRLWVAAIVMCGMCSDDKFMDFRAWLIAQGKAVYERALENPDSLSELEKIDGDSGRPTLFHMTYVASEAYREKINDKIADLPMEYRKSVLLNEDAGTWDNVRVAAAFPKLCARYARTNA